jgi:hypothetical protein
VSDAVDAARERRYWRLAIRVAVERRELASAADLLRRLDKLEVGTRRDQLDTASLRARFFSAGGMYGLALREAVDAARLASRLYAELRNGSPAGLGDRLVESRRSHVLHALEVLHATARSEDESEEILQVARDVLSTTQLEEVAGSRRQGLGVSDQRPGSRQIWCDLVGASWQDLDPVSQRDLVNSQVHAHAMTVDLDRAAHLMSVAVERELERRVVALAREALCGDSKELNRWRGASWSSLGASETLVGKIAVVLRGCLTESLPKVEAVRNAFKPYSGAIAAVASLREPILLGESGSSTLQEIRNTVVHGRDGVALDRVGLDRVKERLVLSETRPLARLLEIPAVRD